MTRRGRRPRALLPPEAAELLSSRAGHPAARAGDTVIVGGLPTRVASEAEAEASDCVVCVSAFKPVSFTDNVFGPCADCGDPLQWRPHAPRTPPKVCVSCVLIRMHKHETELR